MRASVVCELDQHHYTSREVHITLLELLDTDELFSVCWISRFHRPKDVVDGLKEDGPRQASAVLGTFARALPGPRQNHICSTKVRTVVSRSITGGQVLAV